MGRKKDGEGKVTTRLGHSHLPSAVYIMAVEHDNGLPYNEIASPPSTMQRPFFSLSLLSVPFHSPVHLYARIYFTIFWGSSLLLLRLGQLKKWRLSSRPRAWLGRPSSDEKRECTYLYPLTTKRPVVSLVRGQVRGGKQRLGVSTRRRRSCEERKKEKKRDNVMDNSCCRPWNAFFPRCCMFQSSSSSFSPVYVFLLLLSAARELQSHYF